MNTKGFTLMELLIVVVIITIFAAVTYPSYKSSIERARANEAVNMVGTILAAEQKHFVNYETYGSTFQDINDFEPTIKKAEGNNNGFDPSLDYFDTEYFRYTLYSTYTEAIRHNSNSYYFRGKFREERVRCYFTDTEGDKICSSLTDRDQTSDGDGNYYPIY